MSTAPTNPAPTDPAPTNPAPRHRPTLAAHAADFARTALANIDREYPNAPAHLLAGPHELVPPRTLHPAFHGAYDWHSSVHMHWLLVRLLRRHPDHIPADAVTAALDAHLTPEALETEAAYLRDHPSFERPYGWAWLLALAAECALLRTPDGDRWAAALAPATRTVADLVLGWLPKATYPVRHGTHANSAFALGLILDSAAPAGVPELARPVGARLHTWFATDHDAALRWEPSGQDFLSPLLAEADAMRRVRTAPEFAAWLSAFLPELADGPVADGPGHSLVPPEVSDPADPQIGHLLGLCLHRATALQAVADALPADDPRRVPLAAAGDAHLHAALPAVRGDDFTLSHWLATFAALALDR